jgi:hypothetical protein
MTTVVPFKSRKTEGPTQPDPAQIELHVVWGDTPLLYASSGRREMLIPTAHAERLAVMAILVNTLHVLAVGVDPA